MRKTFWQNWQNWPPYAQAIWAVYTLALSVFILMVVVPATNNHRPLSHPLFMLAGILGLIGSVIMLVGVVMALLAHSHKRSSSRY